MGYYMRSTRECSFGQRRPELVQAIRDYLQKHELGTIEADISICCETMSEKKGTDGSANAVAYRCRVRLSRSRLGPLAYHQL